MKVNIKKQLKGEFTIETALVMPILLFIISGIFKILFLWYDTTLAVQFSYLAAMRGVRIIGSEEEQRKEILSYLEEYTGNELRAFTLREAAAEKGSKSWTVKVEGTVFGVGQELLVSQKAEEVKPVKEIRILRKVERALEE